MSSYPYPPEFLEHIRRSEIRIEREKVARAAARRQWWKELFESWRGVHIR